MSDLLIRAAAAEDADAIAALHVASWRDSFRGMIPDAVLDGPMLDERLPMWRQTLSAMPAGRFVLVATEPNEDGTTRIDGFASGGRRRGRDRANLPFEAEIYTLYIAAARRGQNLGCRLMASMGVRLQLFGHASVMLWTLQANTAGRAFYEGLGGRPVGQREEWFAGTPLREVGYGWSRIENLLGACGDRLTIAS
ncbi:MAG: GNAT family N-acetyltransferase [Pseudomonadota bacterium]